ncbi:hypothetical protein AJ78_00603 [Emergomyces pasteurianus Ep9510]|uniref:Uncharacterized protein n=1 Tax=Emergomyces pasteurianus Ep9510 TaxID=1447872 RepID=A0A1J9QVV5_9EURO|nr:hypothetical protein AJ78_00603 [Emergomyces pasteurianus Ep9510]
MPFRARLKRLWQKKKSKVTNDATTTVNVPTTPESHNPKLDAADSAVFIAASTTILASSKNVGEISSPSVIPNRTPEIISTQTEVPKSSQDLKLNNLWDEAYNELRKEDAKLVDAYERGLFAIQDLNQKAPEGEDREIQLQKLLNSKLQDIENSQMKISIHGKDVVIRDQVRKVVQSILSVKDYIGTVASTEPHAALAWTGVLILLPVIAHPITQDDDALDGLEYISELLVRCKVTEDTYRENLACTLAASNSSVPAYLLELNVSFKTKAVSVYSQILRYQISLSQQYSRSGLFRFLRDIVIADDWQGMLKSIKGTEESISKVLDTFDSRTLKIIGEQVAILRNNADKSLSLLLDTKASVEKINQSQLLGKLHRAEYAAFNTFTKADHPPPRCLEGTRVDILREIQHWGNGHRGECICWVRSFAGTGKSTLARTIAHHFNEEGRLGASFFFSRGKKDLGDTTAVLTTIAVQLAEALPDLKSDICDAIEKHGDIGQQPLYNQWQKLIFQPLIKLDRKLLLPLVLVFVLDALDECEGDEHLDEILQLLTTLKDLEVLQVKVLLTSRPERSIYASFRELPDIVHHDLTLHSVPKAVIDADISIFLRHELGKIKSKKRIERSWPGDESIQTLVQKAAGLFIYAATVCRFVAESRFPEKSMTKLLEAESMSRSTTGELDKMYSDILEHGLSGGSDEDNEEMKSLFKQIVGSIVVLFEGLPKSALTSILDLPSSDIIEVLESLHSVLDIPDDESSPIQLFHLSFRDFLFSDERCANPGFAIKEEAAHGELLTKCLDLMSKHLKQDICELRYPGVSVAEVKKSSVETFLPPEVQYACKYWIHHLQKSQIDIHDDGEVHIFLLKHLLHWVEALSLMANMSDAIIMFGWLESSLAHKSDTSPGLFSLVNDAKRFILNFRSIIEAAPLQIYSSALVFSPKKSQIRKQFWDELPSWVTNVIPAEENWNPSLLTLEHPQSVQQLLFSLDGQFLISSTGDIVNTWDTTTGIQGDIPDISQSLFPSNRRIVALSPDNKLLACTSAVDHKIRVWDWKKRVVRHTLEGHSGTINSIAFSPNGKHLASVSEDRSMRLWNLTTGNSKLLFHCRSRAANVQPQTTMFGGPRERLHAQNDIIFSTDGSLIASHASDCHVRLWDPTNAASRGTLAHPCPLISIAFSFDVEFLASSCSDGIVRIWNVRTSELCGTLTHGKPDVSPRFPHFSFSPDNRLIACIANEAIELWDLKTLTLCGTLRDNTQSTRCVFSPSGRLLAAASGNHVKLWDIQDNELRGILEGHTSKITALEFSPNGQVLASGSHDKKAMLWNPATASISKINESYITNVELLGNGEYVATLSNENTTEIRDSSTGDLIFQVPDIMGPGDKMTYSSTSQVFAYEDDDTIRLWNMRTGKPLGRLTADSVVNALAFSPDGINLAASYAARFIIIWDWKTKSKLHVLNGHLNNISYLTFSPNSKMLVSGSWDASIRLWDCKTGEPLGVLQHATPVRDMVISSDANSIICKSSGRATVWNLNTKQIVKDFDLINKEVLCEDKEQTPVSLFESLDLLPLSSFDWDKCQLKCIPSLYTRNSWITYGLENVLWIPGDYRHSFEKTMDLHGGIIALGCRSDKLMLLQLDQDLIPLGK